MLSKPLIHLTELPSIHFNKRFANEPPKDDYFMQLSYFAGGHYHPELNYYIYPYRNR